MLTIFTRSLVCSLIHSYVHSYVHSFTVRSLVCLIVHRMFARSHSRSSYVHIHVHRMFTFTFTACLRCSQCVSVFKSFQYCLLFPFDYQIWAENSWQTKSRPKSSEQGPQSAFRERAMVPKVGCGGTPVNRPSFPSVLEFSGCCAENHSHEHWRQHQDKTGAFIRFLLEIPNKHCQIYSISE